MAALATDEHSTPRQTPRNVAANGSDLPMLLDGAKLRQLSDTKKRAVRHCNQNLRSDQQKCHRVPNSILVNAYNETDDFRIKEEIVKFNYSHDNVFAGRNNKSHTRMEIAFKKGTASGTFYNQKKRFT